MNAISLRRVSKRYLLGTRGGLRHLGSELLRRRQREELWALQDVSLAVEQGSSLALVGPNGAGKSTLLKVVSRVTAPTSGRVRVRGRMSSLIEVGAGFHHELTGRENVFLNGAILGLTRKEIARRLDDIVEFAELERFIDTPVKRYSNGMFARLGFSVAVHTDPEVLLVDEVLAVGDARFRKRSYEKVQQLAAENRTVVVVSHQMSMVRRICNRGVMLDAGRVVFSGTADATADYYEAHMSPLVRASETIGDSDIDIEILEIARDDGSAAIRTGEPMRVRARVLRRVDDGDAVLTVGLNRLDGLHVLLARCSDPLPAGVPVEIEARLPMLTVAPGSYYLHVSVRDANEPSAVRENAMMVVAVDGDDPFHLGAATTAMVDWRTVPVMRKVS